MRSSGIAVTLDGGQRHIPAPFTFMFLGFDDLLWKGYDAVRAKGVTAVVMTPNQEAQNTAYEKMIGDPRSWTPGKARIPHVCVAGEFMSFPDPKGPIGWHNVGLVALQDHTSSVAEFLIMIVSAKLLKQGDPWYAKLGVKTLISEGKVRVLGREDDVGKICGDIAEDIKASPLPPLPPRRFIPRKFGESTIVSRSCTIGPGDAKQACAAGRNLLIVKEVDNICGGTTTNPVQVRFAPLWAVAITASGFFAITPAVWRRDGLSPDDLRRILLTHGGREATHYKVTIGEDVAWGGSGEKDKADSDLCVLEFETYLIGRDALAASGVAADLSSVKDLDSVEVMQLGFPISYCSNPAVGALAKAPFDPAADPPATSSQAQNVKPGPKKVLAKMAEGLQPARKLLKTIKEKVRPSTGQLQWVANTHMAQVQTKFLCPVPDIQAGQDSLTMTLPTSCTRGDTGGGVYLILQDPNDPAKKVQSLLGIIVGGQDGKHLSWAWPVNEKSEGLLDAADWTKFLPPAPADVASTATAAG